MLVFTFEGLSIAIEKVLVVAPVVVLAAVALRPEQALRVLGEQMLAKLKPPTAHIQPEPGIEQNPRVRLTTRNSIQVTQVLELMRLTTTACQLELDRFLLLLLLLLLNLDTFG